MANLTQKLLDEDTRWIYLQNTMGENYSTRRTIRTQVRFFTNTANSYGMDLNNLGVLLHIVQQWTNLPPWQVLEYLRVKYERDQSSSDARTWDTSTSNGTEQVRLYYGSFKQVSHLR